MSSLLWSKNAARKIVRRIVVTGDLVLVTPAHFGNGEGDESVLPLQTDSIDSTRPLLPGPSIAGALRAYLRTRENDYDTAEAIGENQTNFMTAALFGAPRGGLTDTEGEQSRLLIDDAVGSSAVLDYRDGVRIDPVSRTALDKGLYTFQMWAAGTTFPLCLELLITENDDAHQLLSALATALHGLESGEICLGARKKRGFGQAEVAQWSVCDYDMHRPDHLLAWLKGDLPADATQTGRAYETLLAEETFPDFRGRFEVEAKFELDGSILIRSAADSASDMPHLKSNGASILSGTSAAGAIRARCRKIANTLGCNADALVDGMFGREGDKANSLRQYKPSASRLIIREAFIAGGVSQLVQSRVSIDRFTGGALDTALFTEQPHWGGEVDLHFELRRPAKHEIGLLMLALKDLWTGDLPLGGESGVGRGRLRGTAALLRYHGPDDHGNYQSWEWELHDRQGVLAIERTEPTWLEECVQELLVQAEGTA